jgi:N-acetylglucosaminyldiphosphoundecaprenol N-acetyl-beta-D-mannosaminyltransferase
MHQTINVATEDIVGYSVCTDPVQKIIPQITDRIRNRTRPCCYFTCLNPHSAEMAARDAEFEAALKGSDFVVADGIGIVYVSRLTGGAIRERITGMDIFSSLSQAMSETGGMSCYFLGSTDDTLAKIRLRMAKEFPNVRIAGSFSPPFKPQFDSRDNSEMIQRINDSGADILWVGLTAPKQEMWIHNNLSELDVAFAGPIGAVFDFYAGNIKRAGPVVQKLGLEWLPRLFQEPRRLWRRSLVSAPSFFLRSVRYRLSKNRRSN